MLPKIEIYKRDCMIDLVKVKDNKYDLAVVDPPYGIKQDGHRENHTRTKLAKSKKYHNALWSMQSPDIV